MENKSKSRAASGAENIKIEKLKDSKTEYDKSIKVILLGDSNVGKSSIIDRLKSNTFKASPSTTITLEHHNLIIKINSFILRMQIWDTAGQEKFDAIASTYYKSTDVVLFVYSIDSMNSFESLKYWYENVKEKLEGDKYIIAIVGNKSDLIENEVVSEDEARNFASERNAIFATISCKQTPEGIDCLFNNLLDELIKKNYFQPSKSYVLDNKKKHNIEKKKQNC